MDVCLIKKIKKNMENTKKVNAKKKVESMEEEKKNKIKLNRMVLLNLFHICLDFWYP